MLQNWLVENVKGNALFLERSRAEEYVTKYGGIIHHMTPTNNVQETPCYGAHLRQEGAPAVSGSEQLPEESSSAGESSSSSGTTGEAVPACRDCGPGEVEGLEQSLPASCHPF